MATLQNTRAHLIWGPMIPGHDLQKWLPGKNLLDAKYWATVKIRSDIKRWLKLGWIKADLAEDMPSPAEPPSPEDLAEFSIKDLSEALANPTVPVQWHPTLEAELAARKNAEVSKNLPPVTPPVTPAADSRKSLTGLRVEDAAPLIEAESDVDTLEAWAEADKRKSITDAVDARLEALALDEG